MKTLKTSLCSAIFALVVFPTIAVSQVKVNEIKYPRKYVLNGETVILLSPLQVKKMNVVFAENEHNKNKVLSLEKEVSLLERMVGEKDTVILFKDRIIEAERDKEKIYNEKIALNELRFRTEMQAKEKTIKRLKWQKFGFISVGVGLGALLILK